MLKIVTEEEFLEISKKTATDLVTSSFNKGTTLDSNTKLVIVGTLTPPTTNYFYCAPRNKIYGFIDKALDELEYKDDARLKALKKGLSQDKYNVLLPDEIIKERVIEIKKILKKHGIAFLDVMENAIRKNNISHDDNNIEFFTLAIDDFKKIDSTATIIANSRLAEKCVGLMNLGINTRYLPQISFKKGIKEEWIKTIKEAIQR